MNNDTIKENEFVLRRLGESFPQFMLDLWSAVPLWLLILTLGVVWARVAYKYVGKPPTPGQADSMANDFLWGLVIGLVALVGLFLPLNILLKFVGTVLAYVLVFGVYAALVLVAAAVRYLFVGTGESRPREAGSGWRGIPVSRLLSWAVTLTVALFVCWVLVAFFGRDSEQIKEPTPALSAFAGSNTVLWYAFVGTVFGLGAVYVVLMYIKDARSVRWYWATNLAVLRICVYAILCFVFLLPARQTWERTEKKSRVVVLIDVTPSMTKVTDEVGAVNPPKRMDVLVKFLTDKDVAFIQKLLKTNPVAVYPFGTRLDETPQIIDRSEQPWGKDEWDALARYDFRPFLLKGLSDGGKDALRNTDTWNAGNAGSPDWASAWFARKDETKLVNGMSDADTATLRENIAKLDRRIDVARTIALGTNVPGSVTAAVNREAPNMVQGIIVFSDGRSNLGSDSAYRELRDRATKEKIPVFTVAVGEDRQVSRIEITDVQTDDTAAPDQGFKVSVEADGTNLGGKSVPVELDVYYLGKDGKLKDPRASEPDFTMKTDPTRRPAGPYQITFTPGDIPHGAVEFVIDPVLLAQEATPKVKSVIEESKTATGIKPVLKEGQWMVRARIPKHENEAFAEAEHVRERDGIQVLQKKLRVLLVAGAPTREFQFVRTFLTREIQDNRASVTLLVQNEAGAAGNLTPNPGEEVIVRWPNRLDLSGKNIDPKEKPYNLNEYDLIVAFDPDWTEITQQQADDLKTWVQRQGGGLIYVADRINTYQLARVEQGSRLDPILEILPVVPEDIIAVKIQAIARTPRRLYLSPPQEQGAELLKLYEPPARPQSEWTDEEKRRAEKLAKDPVAGWEMFFTDRDQYAKVDDYKVELFPHRGFYSCYPVKEVKPGNPVLAEFADVDAAGNRVNRPWLVTTNPTAAWRTCFLGSGEMYRMYAFDPGGLGKEFYERFWAKLMKYMAAKRNVKASRGRVLISKEYISGYPIRLQAQVLNTNAKPYGPTEKDIKFRIVQTGPGGEKKEFGPFEMTAKQSASGFDGYYQGQVLADPKVLPPGDFDYTAMVDVPDSAGETLQGKFRIVPSDVEMDNTRPDFARMLEMASEFDLDFQGRLSDRVKSDLAGSLPKDNGVPKLAFKLGETELLKLIPDCFVTKESRADNRGPMNDLWDRGIEFPDRKDEGNFWEKNVPGFLAGKTIPISWVMLVVVGLLCWEWLTRKLLRLA